MSYLTFKNGCCGTLVSAEFKPHARYREGQKRYDKKFKKT
jgi:hypothetical protein